MAEPQRRLNSHSGRSLMTKSGSDGEVEPKFGMGIYG